MTSRAVPSELANADGWLRKPRAKCDVVMKGGITSGVIYPRALVELARTHEFRGIGGSSAGAIGAAFGAAAEFGRASGGFAKLYSLPQELVLKDLFRPEPSTRVLLPVLLAFAGFSSKGVKRGGLAQFGAIIVTLATRLWFAGILGLLGGGSLLIAAFLSGRMPDPLFIVTGALLALVGWVVAMLVRLGWGLTRSVPRNLFGICRGLDPTGGERGLTNWMSVRLDRIAGLDETQGPLRFGHLWTGRAVLKENHLREVEVDDRRVDLRMISTCLSWARPFEMPLRARTFLYDPVEWAKLFPADVMECLERFSPADPQAEAHVPSLRRLPEPADLPVIVATRMSLSFPLLISAVPLWSMVYGDHGEDAETEMASGTTVRYVQLWFTDGGLASNFPVHMFDTPLPTRPTFAINLGSFPATQTEPFPDQDDNISYAKDNKTIPNTYREIPPQGFGAVTGFFSAVFATTRDWHDNAHLEVPGYRDRIVLVRQTSSEGGLNLNMQQETINELSDRGEVAAARIAEQFAEKRYPRGGRNALSRTGWDNHRWVRYRALMAGMPAFLGAFQRGDDALKMGSGRLPSYPFEGDSAEVADLITENLRNAASGVAEFDEKTLDNLTKTPGPPTVIRRVPTL
jgi:predicted acylesterase/phospholipase RssA